MADQKHTRNLINNYNRRLQKLEEQSALYGLDTSPQILIEIEEIQKKITQLQRNLESSSSDADDELTKVCRYGPIAWNRLCVDSAESRQQESNKK